MSIWVPQRKTRAELALTGRGLITEPFSQLACAASQAMTSQTVYFTLVGLRKSDVVTNVCFIVAGAGATLTLGKVAIYGADGTLLQGSASDTTKYTSTGGKVHALSAPYTVTADGDFYVAVLVVGTTPPSLLRGVNQTGGGDPFGSGHRPAGTQAAQADLPSPATLGSSTFGLWLAPS